MCGPGRLQNSLAEWACTHTHTHTYTHTHTINISIEQKISYPLASFSHACPSKRLRGLLFLARSAGSSQVSLVFSSYVDPPNRRVPSAPAGVCIVTSNAHKDRSQTKIAMYACMHVCMYVFLSVCVICVYVCMHVN
jgi:hypothetical protein